MDKAKIKEFFIVSGMILGIILAVVLIVWIPFKVIPSLLSGSTNFVAATLTEDFSSTTKKSSGATSTNTTTTNYGNQNAVSYYGKSDLSISLVSEGVIDQTTNQFYNSGSAIVNSTIMIKFEVRNIGTNSTGPWTLRLNTPDYNGNYDTSHSSINPGAGILFTVTYRAGYSGLNNTYITADPSNTIDEYSETNNTLSVPVTVNGSTYNNNYNYNNYPAISAYCYPSSTGAIAGSQVTWYAVASGGNGYYSYFWQGSENLSGNTSVVNHVYNVRGTQSASVTIISNGQAVTKQCNSGIAIY